MVLLWVDYWAALLKTNHKPKQANNMKPNTVIDVRSPEEYMGGHVAGSINIPLQDITNHVEEVKAMPKPIMLCCASGNRSGQATAYLKIMGVDCQNGGSWFDVNYLTQFMQ